jgi:hypothetical protein
MKHPRCTKSAEAEHPGCKKRPQNQKKQNLAVNQEISGFKGNQAHDRQAWRLWASKPPVRARRQQPLHAVARTS